MKLAEWMAANGVDDVALAEAIGITRSSASRIRREKWVPSSATISKIVALTNGQVEPNSFFEVARAA